MPERGQQQIDDAELASLARALALESPYRRLPTRPFNSVSPQYAQARAGASWGLWNDVEGLDRAYGHRSPC